MFTLGSETLDVQAVRLQLERSLTPVLEKEPARISMAVRTLDGVSLFDWHVQRAMPSASLIKVPMLLCLLEEVAKNRVSLNDMRALPSSNRAGGTGILSQLPSVQELSLRELAHLMIVLSDNVATNALIDVLGMDRINQWCRQAGLAYTELQRHMMDAQARAQGKDNWTSAADACTTLLYLLQSPVLPETLRNEGLQMLADQRERGHFAATLPAEVELAHKTGSLFSLRHDAGIMTVGKRSVVLAVLGDGFTDARTSSTLYGGEGAAVLATLAARVAGVLQAG